MSSIVSLLALVLLAMSSSTVAFGPAPVNLRSAANYTILAQTGVSTVPSSAITGAIGVSPVADTFLTGFASTLDSTGTFSTSVQVTGKLFAASYSSPTPATLITATSDLQTAYTDAAGRVNPDFLNLGSGEIGSRILTPGLYKWTSGVTVSNDVTLFGTSFDTWIFQIPGTFSIATGKRITLFGGVLAKNIVWVVDGSVAFRAGAHFEGVLIGKTATTLQTGATANGRVLAQTFVALQKATVVPPA